MAAEPTRHLLPAAPAELPLKLQRELWLLMDRFYDGEQCVDVDGMATAIAEWVFAHELLYVPATEHMAREGLRFYPTSPHTIAPVWVVQPAPAPRGAPAPSARRPSLRDLGAQRIDGDRV